MTTTPDGKHLLAAFIEAVMTTPVDPSDSENHSNMSEHAAQYHLELYQQIADLAWAVLNEDPTLWGTLVPYGELSCMP